LENPDFTSAVNYLRGEGAQSIPPDIKKIMEDSNLWGENIEEDFMNSIASDRKSVVRLVGLCPLFQSKYCFSICSLFIKYGSSPFCCNLFRN
jgi:hypothetical protein